jgi:hypothetical protein
MDTGMIKKTECPEVLYNNCVNYKLTCDGEQRYIINYRNKQKCESMKRAPDNTPSHVQARAFASLFSIKVKCGMSHLNAFVEAITQTSDDMFVQADRGMVAEYKQQYSRQRKGR